jgi:type II secretory pathway predicted ATPase ExeA
MYLELFKLTELPFRLAPDPEFLYLSKNHARAKAYMESTIWFTDGFVIITGEIGAGKTTLIETFLSELEKDVIVAQINQTQLTPVEFLQSVLVQFGFEPFQMKKVELMSTLNNFLIEQHSNGRRVLLIIDEAQNLSTKVLEEVRLLSGIETTKEKVMRIILAGQPELNHKLNLPELAQLTQRVRLRFHLTALSREDSEHYIQHRLEVAGSSSREIFAADTYEVIYRYTGGVPRLINTLCDTAMMAAFAQDQDTISVATLQTAIAELRWTEHAAMSAKLPIYQSPQSNDDQSNGSSEILAHLLLSHKGETLHDIELRPGRLLIGRTPENDLQIDSTFVSRHHAQIMSTQGSCIIEDLNSTNGITHNGKRIRRRVLNDGDVLILGEHELAYMDERNMRQRPQSTAIDDAVPMLSETTHLPQSMAVKQPKTKLGAKTVED